MIEQHDTATPRATRTVRLLFAGLALASLAIALTLYTLADRLGLDEFTGRLLATAFLAAAVADALILYFWDRLFTPKG